jgi:aspartate/methionine/tyrosine aminotransferase
MPRPYRFSPSVGTIEGNVYSALAHRLAGFSGEVYPLHVGDTWLEPPEGSRMEDFTVAEHPGMHRYAPPQGLPALLETVASRVTRRSGVPTTPDNVLIATGATGALGAIAGAILAPGDEVLILSPHWPLVSGIMRSFHGVSVEVPFFGAVDSAETALDTVKTYLTERTVALYLNTPCNPTGQVMPRSWIEALVGWAERENLWLISDEVYEDYLYSDEAHTYTRTLAPERTFSVYSFSKAYGMAGNRCGYVIAPQAALPELKKIGLHSFYSTPTASQLAALAVLNDAGDRWIAAAREQYRTAGTKAAQRLGVPVPTGSTFLFMDVADHLDERGLAGLLEDCVEHGLFVAPGPSFGPYPTHIRLCFTSAKPDVVERGVNVLAQILRR